MPNSTSCTMKNSTPPAKGRAKGGQARAVALTPERRKEISQRAAAAKAHKASLPVAEYSGTLKIGDLEFPCAVLSDGKRVLTETDFMAGLGMYRSGALSVRRDSSEGSAQMPLYLAYKNLYPFVIKHLGEVHEHRLEYKTLSGGIANGIQASLIPKICSVWLDARREISLGERQRTIADKAELLMRGLAEVGIVALVDEATGYQSVRSKDALAKILEAFVAKELQPYVKTFPPAFYENLFRLRGLKYPPETPKFRPQYFGLLTNDIVYERLAPGLLEELKKQAGKDEKKAKLHQRLTQEVGHPKLREHLASVIMAMKMSKDYASFISVLNEHFPRFGNTYELGLETPDL